MPASRPRVKRSLADGYRVRAQQLAVGLLALDARELIGDLIQPGEQPPLHEVTVWWSERAFEEGMTRPAAAPTVHTASLRYRLQGLVPCWSWHKL